MEYFNEQMEAAKFALSLAINKDVEPGRAENTETVWNVGSFDPDNEIRDLIEALYPEIDYPYLAMEYFINEGFRIIGEHIEENKQVDLLALID